MESHSQHAEYARELREALDAENLSLIDFDRWRQWLSEIGQILDEIRQLRDDEAVLRQDLIARIGGMVKAIAAVDRHPVEWGAAAAFVENLSSLSAAELVEQYRKTSARFRDAFPASFGLVFRRNRGEVRARDVEVFR